MASLARTFLLFSILSLAAAANAQVHELAPADSSWKSHLAPGAKLEVKGGLGNVTVVASDGDAFEVAATHGTSGTKQARIVVVESPGGAVVCADWRTAAGSPSPCGASRGMLSDSTPRDYVSADLRIAVPHGTSVDAQVAKGNITIEPLGASIRTKTYEGDISATADGDDFAADNHYGVVEVRIGTQTRKQHIELSTIGGRARAIIPESRLVHYDIYSHGAPLYSAYPIAPPERARRDDPREIKMLRRIMRNDYTGTIGPNGRIYANLEIYAIDPTKAAIEIAMP